MDSKKRAELRGHYHCTECESWAYIHTVVCGCDGGYYEGGGNPIPELLDEIERLERELSKATESALKATVNSIKAISVGERATTAAELIVIERDQALAKIEQIQGLERIEVPQRVKIDGLLLHSGSTMYVKAADLEKILKGESDGD
jgi:hypothetical protein